MNGFAHQRSFNQDIAGKISSLFYDTLACTQEIKYSDIKWGLLPALIADIAEIVDPLIGKNTKASVWTMSKDWNAWAKWQA